jgi:hypothetical protein
MEIVTSPSPTSVLVRGIKARDPDVTDPRHSVSHLRGALTNAHAVLLALRNSNAAVVVWPVTDGAVVSPASLALTAEAQCRCAQAARDANESS